MSNDTESILHEEFPQIDADNSKYILGILDLSKDELASTQEVFEAVGENLVGISEGLKNESDIMEICTRLLNSLKVDKNNSNQQTSTHKILDAPVYLNQMALQLEGQTEDIRSIWMPQRDAISTVDQKKLQQAEAKLKQKKEKRENADKIPNNVPLSNKEATAVQAIRKKDAKMENKGTNKALDIKIENFDVAFGDKLLLQNAELTLSFGRRYGMVGRNGIGKSTLLKMISNGHLKIQSHLTLLHVEQEVVGDETRAIDSVLECDEVRQGLLDEEKRLQLQMADNAKSGADDFSTRLSEIYLELQAIEADKAPSRASRVLAGLGFTPTMQQTFTKEFSGGWRMRIALARALFSKPDLLLLDEPTNMLDMKAIIWLETYLQTWLSTLLVVSHDRKFLDTVATDIFHFHSRRLDTYRGNYDNFVKSMNEKLKSQQRQYDAQMLEREHVQVFIDKFRFNAKRASLVQSKIKYLEKMPVLKPIEKVSSVVLHFPETEKLLPPILQLDEVSFSYTPESRTVLKKINLSANMESRICIVGDNGSGKTTLLKLLTGELNPTSGIRHVHRNLVVGYFTQHHVDQLDMSVSSLEFLSKKFPGKPSEEYRRQLGRFGVTGDLALQPVSTLSGGQKSRVAFTIMAMLNPHFLILDEPTNHLDVETVEALGIALRKYTGGVVLVSHDEQLIELVCDELWVCKDGNVSTLSGGFQHYRKLVETELQELAH